MFHRDVVVAGGGIAGCAAAVSLARAGLATAIIRQPVFGGVDFPETLAPMALALLGELGVEVEMINKSFPRITSRFSRWGSGPLQHDDMLPRAGASLLLGKSRLRSILWDIVLRHDIEIVEAAQITEARQESDRIILQLRLAKEPTDVEIVARFAIDATGRASMLARRLGVRRRIFDTLVSFWISGDIGYDARHMITTATVQDGWIFCSGAEVGKAAIGFFTAGSHVHQKPTSTSIVDRASSIPHIANLINSSQAWRYSPVVTLNAASSQLTSPGGPNWIACGDALQTVDPIASSGTYLALKQGILAARTIEAAFAENQQLRRTYESISRTDFQNILAQRNAYYGLTPVVKASVPSWHGMS